MEVRLVLVICIKRKVMGAVGGPGSAAQIQNKQNGEQCIANQFWRMCPKAKLFWATLQISEHSSTLAPNIEDPLV